MSTEMADMTKQPKSDSNGVNSNEENNINVNVNVKSTIEPPQSSLDTPTRESDSTNENIENENGNVNVNDGGGATTDPNVENEIEKIEETKIIKYSNVKSSDNPITIAREKLKKEGRPLMVNFDERVVVHTVPYWDPCGETFYDKDDEDGPRGPNCCIIL